MLRVRLGAPALATAAVACGGTYEGTVEDTGDDADPDPAVDRSDLQDRFPAKM